MPAEKERRVTFQDVGTEYVITHHESAYGPCDGMWELGIYYASEAAAGDDHVTSFDVRSHPDGYSDDELIAMARSVLAQVADGTW
jgi:hypothetical protein